MTILETVQEAGRGSRCCRFWCWPRGERFAEIRGDLGRASNEGQRKTRRNPQGESALMHRTRLAIHLNALSRGPSLLVGQFLTGRNWQ